MLSGWGRVFGPGREVASEDLDAITRGVGLTRGLARSYGDSSLPHPSDGVVASSRLADRILSFDEATGVVRAESGFSLLQINRTFWQRGRVAIEEQGIRRAVVQHHEARLGADTRGNHGLVPIAHSKWDRPQHLPFSQQTCPGRAQAPARQGQRQGERGQHPQRAHGG